jgi:hypothetical protein
VVAKSGNSLSFSLSRRNIERGKISFSEVIRLVGVLFCSAGMGTTTVGNAVDWRGIIPH